MAQYEYSVSLKDGVSSVAKTATGNVNELHKAIKGGMAEAMTGAAMAMKVGQQSIGAAINGIKSAFTSLAAGDVQGAVSGLTEGVAGIAKSLDLLVPGLGEAAAALIEFAGGALGAVIGGAKMALQANEAQTKMLALFDTLGEGKVSGAAVVDMLDGLGDQLGMTKDKLAPLAKGFLTMGITGTDQIRALTIAAAGLNEITAGAGDGFTKLYGQVNAAAASGSKLTIPYRKLDAQLRAMGLNQGDIAKKMGISTEKLVSGLKAGTIDAKVFGDALTGAATDKGAGPLAKAGNSLANVWAKAGESVMDLFKDLQPAIDPFLEQVRMLFDILGQGKASGNALKAGVGGFFTQVFQQATKVVPYVKHFLLDLVILGLKAYIALKPIVAWFVALKQNSTVMAVLGAAFDGLLTAAKAVGIAILFVVAVVAVFVGALVGIQVAIVAVGGIILGFVTDAMTALGDWATGAASAAVNFVSGLVDGIKSGAGAVVDAVKGLAKGASDAFKSALGIHSPSKVMMQMGGHVAGGAAEGISAGAPEVHAASQDLAKAASGGFAAGGDDAATGGAAGGRSKSTFHIDVGGIHIDGAGKGADELTEQAVSLLFERVALSQGL